jgi:hypothetical protein
VGAYRKYEIACHSELENPSKLMIVASWLLSGEFGSSGLTITADAPLKMQSQKFPVGK